MEIFFFLKKFICKKKFWIIFFFYYCIFLCLSVYFLFLFYRKWSLYFLSGLGWIFFGRVRGKERLEIIYFFEVVVYLVRVCIEGKEIRF